MSWRTNRRGGFTLLEVLLAGGIAVLVMAALYYTLEIQLRQTQIGREVVEEAVLVRSLLNRMSQDIACSLRAPAKQAETTTVTEESSAGQFNLGLQGSFDRIEMQASRVPRFPQGDTPLTTVGDLRRISYWMTASGLAREEVKLFTTEEPAAEESLIIAPEVRNVQFRYFDGSAWQETWDGSTVANGSPRGPPLAVEIILEVGPPSEEAFLDPDTVLPTWKRYRHVVSVLTATMPARTTTTTTTSP
jgi:hypothetical protein